MAPYSCAQQQSRPRPAHPRWGEAWEERGRNHRWHDVWANPGPDTNGLTLHDSRDRDASVRHKSPASTQHTHRVAQSTTVLQRGLITGALSRAQGKLKQPLDPHARGDTPEAPTSLTDIDTHSRMRAAVRTLRPQKNRYRPGAALLCCQHRAAVNCAARADPGTRAGRVHTGYDPAPLSPPRLP